MVGRPSRYSRSKIAYVTGISRAARATALSDVEVHPFLQALEARQPTLVEGDDLPVEHRIVPAQLAPQRMQLGIAGADLFAVAALDPHVPGMPGTPVEQRPHTIPLDLERPPLLLPRQAPGDRRASARDARASPRPLLHLGHLLSITDSVRIAGDPWAASTISEACKRCREIRQGGTDQRRRPSRGARWPGIC